MELCLYNLLFGFLI
ncbi:hypothetical protein PMLGA01_120045800 [Plasmodium malariae]|uniref:Uncharacterized protein n=1 Tax=Plasmodium malariae TaxID=5858 RepID=A0A1C3L175_PLAMA|nr:hypothetical protein PMLGA01_120045800 [Plasmodium malariae]